MNFALLQKKVLLSFKDMRILFDGTLDNNGLIVHFLVELSKKMAAETLL